MLSLSAMSDSFPHGPRSDDVRNTSRQSPWTSVPHTRFSGPPSQRSSPGGSDLTPTRLSFERLSMDQRPFGSHDDYYPPPTSFSSSTTTDSNTLSPLGLIRSAPDNSRSFGTRSMGLGTYDIYSSDVPSIRQEHEDSIHQPDTNLPRTTRSSRPPYRGDTFEGPAQLLPLPLPDQLQSRDQTLLDLPVNLSPQEQEEVAQQTNDILSDCAFHFVARYQFPIPIEREKPWVRQASDRDWTEWAYLLKKLATKRRIPARVLFEGQIKQFVTTLENSIAVRQTTNTRTELPTPRRPRDDRYMLQLVSSALQVAKILQDAVAMEQLNGLYIDTEARILARRRMSSSQSGVGVGRGVRDTPGPVARPVGRGSVGGGVIGRGLPGGMGGVGRGNTSGY